MLFDVEETPIINNLQINGRLTFEDGVKDLHLRAKYIWVRAGELNVGSQSQPFQKNAKITLYGEKASQHIVFQNNIEAGNKILANTNQVQLYGKARHSHSRLRKEAYPGDTSIQVSSGLDWKVGDKIGLAPTGMRFNDTDFAIISAYNSATGVATLDRSLTAYHYGALQSTAPTYGGVVDIRGEVVMLSRNIKIAGQDIEAWGCQVLTSEFLEKSGQVRSGRTIMDNVEIYNCSQYDTEKAALRFEGLTVSSSVISNSAIYHGLGWGVAIQSSSNVILRRNVIFGFVKMGVNINSSQKVTIDGNLVIDVSERTVIALDKATDIFGGILACALVPGDSCSDISVVNNIVSGVYYVGFAAYGHECNKYQQSNFKNNTAHSIDGVGAVIFQDPLSAQQRTCLEGSNFYAYKTTQDGAISFFNYREIIYSNMIFIDCGYGPNTMLGQEGDDLVARMKNIKMYGESPARDCFYQDECSTRWHQGCTARNGMMISYFATAGKEVLPKSKSSLPMHKVKKDASWGGKSEYDGLEFIGYSDNKTWCGASQRAIVLNPTGADYIPRAKFIRTRFENVNQNALTFMMSPPSGWANIDDCGDFPCTSPNNILLQFEFNTYAGTVRPLYTERTFQIIANNPDGIRGFSNCRLINEWNANLCTNDNLGILLFESQDDDKFKRMVTPIYVENAALNSSNKLNTFMDHIWDGFYTGQLRMSRWPSIIQTGSTMSYELKYTGTPPGAQRFTLIADLSSAVITIRYPKAEAYQVLDSNGRVINENSWDKDISAPSAIKRGQCGENRFEGTTNILQFHITRGCTLQVVPVDSIRVSVRMRWTLDEFFANNGTSKFIDRLTAALGIHPSNVKIVKIYKGSVVVEFDFVDSVSNPLTGGVKAIASKFAELVKKNQINLGAPILDASAGSFSIKEDPTRTNNGGNNGGNNNGGNTNTGGTIVISKDEEESNQKVLIIVMCAIAGLILIGSVVGYFIYKRYQKANELKTIETKSKVMQQNSAHNSNLNINGEEEEYMPQYHPKAELGNIFGGYRDKSTVADALNCASPPDSPGLNYHSGDVENDGPAYTNQTNAHRKSEIQEGTPLHSAKESNTVGFKQKTSSKRVSVYDDEEGRNN